MIKRVKLRDEASLITKGTTPTTIGKDFVENGIPFLRAQNIINGEVLIDSDILFIDKETHNNDLRRSQIQKGDLLITIAGTIGRTAIVRNEINGLNCNQAVAIIRMDSKKIDLEYLKRFIETEDAQRQFNKSKVTATISNLSLGQVGMLEIPLPPLATQKKIAAILDAADAYRKKTKTLIEKYDQLAQSLFLDMFGDPVRNEMGWKVNNLKSISTKILSGNTPKGGSEVYVNEGITFFRSQNVWRNRIELEDVAYIDQNTHDKMRNSSLKHRDILITKTGRFNTENSSLGRAAMFLGEDDTANINGHVYLIRLKKGIINEFVLFIITTDQFRDHIRRVCVGGIDKRQLNKEHLEEFPIISPPIELQQKFTNILLSIEAQKQQAQASLQKAEDLFNSLLQRAFKGRLVS